MMKSFGSFLNEGSIPGEKRGPYQDTKAMKDKLPDDEIKKASTAILQGWVERGGVNASAAAAELAKRGEDVPKKGSEDPDKDPKNQGDGEGSNDKEISLDKESKKSREGFLDKKNDIMDMMDVPEDDRQETEITVDNSKEEKLKAQEEKYRKIKEKWESRKEKFFSVIDPESRLGKALNSFFEAEPVPFPGMGNEAETVVDALADYYKLRAGAKASKYGKKETKARDKAEKASKKAQEKAEKERKEREEREEKRRKKTQKEEYKSLRSCISEVWTKT